MAKLGRANQLFKPEFQFGLGGVPLGNEFEVVTDEGAMKTMEASWSAGVRYFDVSPWYGLGLAERRLLNRPQPAVYHLLHSLGQQCRDMVERVAVLGAAATLKSRTKRPDLKRCVGCDATT